MAQPTINTLFSIRSMIRAVEQWKTPQLFFINMFFKEIATHKTRYVEVNFFDQKRRIAPFIHRESSGQLVENTSYDKFIYEPPYVKPLMAISPTDLQEALIDENAYSETDPGLRLATLRNMKLKELDDMISRREEIMAVQSVFDRSISIVDENGNATQDAITFSATSGHDFSIDWSTPASSTPIEDIRTAQRKIAQRTGLNAQICVHGTTNADNFLKSSDTRELLDNRRIAIGDIRMERINQAESMGAIYMGTMEGIDHFRYDEWYLDPATDTETALISATKSVLGSDMARSIRHYAMIETLNGPMQMRRWPKFYDGKDKDPEIYGIQIHSSPLTVTHQPDAFCVMTQS